MAESTTIVAFDQHAATTVAAVLLPGPADAGAAPDDVGCSTSCGRSFARLRRQGAVRCCYEAGPCGFELQRALTADGVPCDVIAPALIPRGPAIASRRIGAMPASSRCSIGRAR